MRLRWLWLPVAGLAVSAGCASQRDQTPAHVAAWATYAYRQPAPVVASAEPVHERSAPPSPDAATPTPHAALPDVWQCENTFPPGCADVARTLEQNCGDLEPGACAMARSMVREAGAKEVCDRGTIEDCGAACGAGRPATCERLAKIYRDGVRIPKDEERADSILRQACGHDDMRACVAVAAAEADANPFVADDAGPAIPAEAVALAMRACQSNDDYSAMQQGCTLWMTILEKDAYRLPPAERAAGLTSVCTRETAGDVQPGTGSVAGDSFVMYRAAACGRLKDMGVSPP
jgi:TPR repeat protein